MTAKVLAAMPIGAVFGLAGAIGPLIVGFVWFAVDGKQQPFDASVLGTLGAVAVQGAYAAMLGAGIGAALRRPARRDRSLCSSTS